MAKEERKELNISTDNEMIEKAERGEELEMHRQFEQWCTANKIYFVHSRTDRKPTITVGTPDFVLLAKSRGCMIEFKSGNAQLTLDQKDQMTRAIDDEVPVMLCRSLQEAIQFARIKLFGV